MRGARGRGEGLPEGDWDGFGAGLGREAGGGEMGEPGDAVVGKLAAEEAGDLFAALLEDGADERLRFRGKNERGVPADEMEEIGIDVGTREEAGRLDFVARGDGVGGLEENGDGAEGFGAGLSDVALRGLLLEHEDHAFGERPGEDGVEPGGGDGVGEVRDDFESGRER